jgi:hypothetical protein
VYEVIQKYDSLWELCTKKTQEKEKSGAIRDAIYSTFCQVFERDVIERLNLLYDQFLFVDLDHKRSSVLASGEPETSRGREGHGDAKVKRRLLALVISL